MLRTIGSELDSIALSCREVIWICDVTKLQTHFHGAYIENRYWPMESRCPIVSSTWKTQNETAGDKTLTRLDCFDTLPLDTQERVEESVHTKLENTKKQQLNSSSHQPTQLKDAS